MTGSLLTISFPDTSMAEANRIASGLAAAVRHCDREVRVEQRRHEPDTLDFGATVAIILCTASIVKWTTIETR